MNICLVRCPSPFLIDERAFPPLGLLAVGTGLRMQGHQVVIHDGLLDDIPMDFGHYGFGPTSPEYPHALKALQRIRCRNHGAKVIIGGPHATLNPGDCLRDGFDCVVIGDGELAAGTAMEDGLRLVYGESRPLDEYPIPDRNLLNLDRYNYRLREQRATTLMTGRGCPYHCAFCCKNHDSVRLRSAEKVIQEIQYLHDDFGFKALAFPEDIFILNRKRTDAVAQHLRALQVIWRCLVRADLCVKYGQSFLEMLAESGCVEVGMGIESGSPRILKTINKGETVETIQEAIRMLKEAGIRIKGYFILGLPGETVDTIAETTQFLETAQLDDIDVKIYQPYPGSPIWEHREHYDISWKDGDLASTFYKGRPGEYFGSVSTSGLTTAELVSAWTKMEATYKKWLP